MDGTSENGGGRRWFVIIPPRDSWMDESVKGRSAKTSKVSTKKKNGHRNPYRVESPSQGSWTSSIWASGKGAMTYLGFATKPPIRIRASSSPSSGSSDELMVDRTNMSASGSQRPPLSSSLSTSSIPPSKSHHRESHQHRSRPRSSQGQGNHSSSQPMAIKDLKEEKITVGSEADDFGERMKQERSNRSSLGGGKHEKDIRRKVRESMSR